MSWYIGAVLSRGYLGQNLAWKESPLSNSEKENQVKKGNWFEIIGGHIVDWENHLGDLQVEYLNRLDLPDGIYRLVLDDDCRWEITR